MALRGVTVLELAGLAPGPFCGMVLRDFGADVIRIDRSDQPRVFPDFLARGKRSIGMNLKHPRAKEIMTRLIGKADVLIDPFRPSVLSRLGLSPSTIMEINPRIVYARLTGFGVDGPHASQAGHDINYLAVSGVLDMLGRAGSNPTPPANLLADFAGGGLLCAMGIILALYERKSSGKGQVIDSAMQDGALYLATSIWKARATPIWNKNRGQNTLDTGAPFYDTYECKDGKYVSVGSVENHFWKIVIEKLNLDTKIDYSNQLDTSTWPETRSLLVEKFKSQPQSFWNNIFAGSDACVFPVVSMNQEAIYYPHNKERATFLANENTSNQSVYATHEPAPAPRLSRTPAVSVLLANPRDGQHTAEVLNQFGFTDNDIVSLKTEKAITIAAAKL